MHYRLAGFGGGSGFDYLREIMPYSFISERTAEHKQQQEKHSELSSELSRDTLQYYQEKLPQGSGKFYGLVSYLRSRVYDEYHAWLKVRLKRIIELAQSDGIDILVFPEYSIPAECLEVVATCGKDMLAVIAGSHFTQQDYAGIYEKVQFKRHEDVDFKYGTDLCPIFLRGQSPDFVSKERATTYEFRSIVPGTGPRSVALGQGDNKWFFGVVLCNEFLPRPAEKDDFLERMKDCKLFVVPSCTSDHTSVWDRARRLLNPPTGIPTIFANSAEYGMSTIFTKSDMQRDVTGWNSRVLCGGHILPLEDHEEGLVAADVLLAPQIVRSQGIAYPTSEHMYTMHPRRVPFLYDGPMLPGLFGELHTFDSAIKELEATEWDSWTFRRYFHGVSEEFPSPLRSGILLLNDRKNYRSLDLETKRSRLRCLIFPEPVELGDLSLPELTFYQLAELFARLLEALDTCPFDSGEKILAMELAKKTAEWQRQIVESYPACVRKSIRETWDLEHIKTTADIKRELTNVFGSEEVLQSEIDRRCKENPVLSRKAGLMTIYMEKCSPRRIPNVIDWT